MKRSPLKPGKQLKRTAMKRKGRKKPTAEQQRYHDKVRDLGCIVSGEKPAQIHHVRDGLGMGQSVNHDRVLPLHYDFHQSEEFGAVSLHGTPKEFKDAYGTEAELEEMLKRKLLDVS